MIRFGYFYLNGKLTIYDISVEVRQGHHMWVAALSEDPRISFAAVRAEHAVHMLKDYMERATRRKRSATVTFIPEDKGTNKVV